MNVTYMKGTHKGEREVTNRRGRKIRRMRGNWRKMLVIKEEVRDRAEEGLGEDKRREREERRKVGEKNSGVAFIE